MSRRRYHIKRTAVLVVPFLRVIECLLRLTCSASKSPQRELLRYLLGYRAEKVSVSYCAVLELVPLKAKQISSQAYKTGSCQLSRVLF